VIGPEQLQVEGDSPAEPPISKSVDDVVVSLSGRTLREVVDDTKRLVVSKAVAAHGGNWAAAARSLGMARGNLHHMARRLGLLDPD
jgi:anaerobic nitric oxide reductase transcription regulator